MTNEKLDLKRVWQETVIIAVGFENAFVMPNRLHEPNAWCAIVTSGYVRPDRTTSTDAVWYQSREAAKQAAYRYLELTEFGPNEI